MLAAAYWAPSVSGSTVLASGGLRRQAKATRSRHRGAIVWLSKVTLRESRPWRRLTRSARISRSRFSSMEAAEFKSAIVGRGMQCEADETERLILAGMTAGDIMPPSETIAIMRTLDTIRSQIGLKYPDE